MCGVKNSVSGNQLERHPYQGWGPPKIGMSYMDRELDHIKLAEAPVYHPGPRPVPTPRRSKTIPKQSIVEAVEYSLQVAVQQFKKICKLKIPKLKGGYLANTALIFNGWLKDIDM